MKLDTDDVQRLGLIFTASEGQIRRIREGKSAVRSSSVEKRNITNDWTSPRKPSSEVVSKIQDRGYRRNLSRRALRGLGILWLGNQIQRVNDKSFLVKSQSGSSQYQVQWRSNKWICNCLDYLERCKPCKHVFAVLCLLKLPSVIIANSGGLERGCPGCGSRRFVRNGERKNKSGPVQTFLCKDCELRFPEGMTKEIRGTNSTLMLVSFDLFYKKVSLRDIQNHIYQIYKISKPVSTIHSWILKLNKIVLRVVKRLEPRVGEKWLADEMVVKVNGRKEYLWNILDYESRIQIVSLLLTGRGEEEAFRALSEALSKVVKPPREFVSDGLQSYSKALHRLDETSKGISHIRNVGLREKKNNNRLESRHSVIRDWSRTKRGMKGRAGEHFEVANAYYNFIRPHLSLQGESPAHDFKDKRWLSLLNSD